MLDLLTRFSPIKLDSDMLDKFNMFAELLKEWNTKINLTSIKDDEGIAVKHFIDSLTVLTAADIPTGATWLDVGSGGGFPSIPVMIVRPDIVMTMMDATGKKITYLREVTSSLDIHAQCVHARAEEAAHTSLRESFDICSARAVTKMSALAELCLPFCKQGGLFIAMKGLNADDEIKGAIEAIRKLGGKLEDVKHLTLPNLDERVVVVIRKIKPTPADYPRAWAKIVKRV